MNINQAQIDKEIIRRRVDAEMSRREQTQTQSAEEGSTKKPMLDLVNEKLPEGQKFSVGNMVSNIPSSAGQLVTDVATAIANPVQTAESLWNVASGFVDKGAETLTASLPVGVVASVNEFNNFLVESGLPLERLPEDPTDMTFEDAKYADSVIGFIDKRYGSYDNFLGTLEEDPVGVLSDVSGLITGGGTVIPKVGKIGSAIDPLNLATRGTAKAIANMPGVKKLPQKLYQSAAKFGTTIEPRKRQAMTQTALDNKIMPRTSGVDKISDLIEGLNTQIDDLVAEASIGGKKVPRNKIYRYINQTRQKLGDVSMDAPKNLKKMEDYINQFEDYMDAIDKPELSAADLQRLKKDLYRSINFDRKTGKARQAVEETRKAVAKAAKEEIERIVPEVKQLNAKEGELIELQDAIQKAAARIENRDLIGIGVPIKGSAGALAGSAVDASGIGAATAITAGIFDNPTVKAKLAIVLNSIQSLDIPNARKQVIVGQIAKLSGRAEESLADEIINDEQANEENSTETDGK